MKNIIIPLSFLLTLFFTNVHAQQYIVYEDDAVEKVYNWLQEGANTFEVLGKDVPDDLKAIIIKYRKAVTKEKIWFDKYKEEHKNVTPLPYDKKFGITKDEYSRLHNEYPSLPLTVTKKENITVIKKDGVITFVGEDDFKFLKPVTINKNDGKLLIENSEKTKYLGATKIDSSAFGKYTGYKWRYELGDKGAVDALQSSNYYSLEITIGQPSGANGKTAFNIKVLLIERMVTRFDSEVSGYLVKKEGATE